MFFTQKAIGTKENCHLPVCFCKIAPDRAENSYKQNHSFTDEPHLNWLSQIRHFGINKKVFHSLNLNLI